MMAPTRCWLWILCWGLGGAWLAAAASATAQPAPARYRVTLRYEIPSPRDQHVVQYDAMIRHLQRLGFEFDPPLEKHRDTDREDRTKNYLNGWIGPKKALALLDHEAVQNLFLVPENFKLPVGPNDPVLVRLELAGNLKPERQRELANQTRVLLREFGFKEPPGYDHRGHAQRYYTRIVGTIPRSKLDLLQRDLRNHPAGWIGPIIPRGELPSPFAVVNPVQVVEVLPDTEAIKELADPEPRTPESLEKISADLWELVKGKEVDARLLRVEVGFVGHPARDDRGWKFTLEETAPGFFVEGQLGQFVTGIMRLDQVKTLAAAPLISFIRLPRTPLLPDEPTVKIQGGNDQALAQAGLKALHDKGYLGQGVRIGIIDCDFRGWEALVKKKLLPAKTRLVDLTTEMNPEIYPAAGANDMPGKDTPGHGTRCAQAAALAAPEAELVLIRVDVGAPHHLADVVRYVQGRRFSNLIELRHGELLARSAQLRARRDDLLEERRAILENFLDETDQREALEFLGSLYEWIYSDRDWHRRRMEHHEKLEDEQHQRQDRFALFMKEIKSLRGIPLVVNSVSWNDGYPLGAISPLSKTLDDARQDPWWFQAVGNVRGQSWLGHFHSIPGDPAMKFADDSRPLPQGRWSHEVNFLGWQPYQGEPKADLPEKVRLRIALQWREPHDPDYFLRPGEDDDYRRPLANLRVQLLRQRDPETKTLPADLFEIVARSSGWPQRLEHLPDGSIYEQVFEVALVKSGRYALRVEKQVDRQWVLGTHPTRKTPIYQLLEGLVPTGIRPLGAPTLTALEKNWELRPRIFVEVLDPASRREGRAVFVDFPTEAGVIGLPADARNVISVGAAGLKNRPQPYSAYGSPLLMELARRPWLYAYDELELAGGGALGTSIANAFAAGTTATLLSTGATRDQVLQYLRSQEGQVLRVREMKK